MRRICLALTLAAGFISAGMSPQAIAEDLAVEEIIVTAQKRAENLQDVLLAITAMGEEMIDERGLTNIYAHDAWPRTYGVRLDINFGE